MAEKAVIDYIKKERAKGIPDEKIRRALHDAGWTKKVIEDAFAAVEETAVEKIPAGKSVVVEEKKKITPGMLKSPRLAAGEKTSVTASTEPPIEAARLEKGPDRAAEEPREVPESLAMPVSSATAKKVVKKNAFSQFFTKIWDIIIQPRLFFESAKEEHAKSSMIFFSVLMAVIALLTLIGTTISMDAGLFTSIEFLYSLGYLLIILLFIFIIIALYVLITFGLVKLFRGEKGISESTKAMLYGTTPSLLLGWIPYVQYAAWLWSAVLQGYGLAKLHNMKWWKALLIMLSTLLILVVIVVLLSLSGVLPEIFA